MTGTPAAGLVVFSNLTLSKVGAGYILDATSGTLSSATTSAISVSPGAATQLVINTEPPASVTAGVGFGLTATAEDVDGNTAISFGGNVTVSLAANPGGSALGGLLTAAAANGVATFTGLSLNKAASGYLLSASSFSLTSTTSTAVSVSPGSATQLAFQTLPSSITAGTGFNITAAAEDAYGNVVPSYSGGVMLSLASGPVGGTLGGTLTGTISSGLGAFSSLLLDKAGGGYTFGLSNGSLTAATSNSLSVTAEAATQLIITAEPPSSVTAEESFGLGVTAQDAYGNLATGFNGSETASLNSGPMGGSLSGTTIITASGGIGTFPNLGLNRAGSGYTLEVASGTLSATTTAISVTAGAATQLIITAEPPLSVTAGPVWVHGHGGGRGRKCHQWVRWQRNRSRTLRVRHEHAHRHTHGHGRERRRQLFWTCPRHGWRWLFSLHH